MFKRVVLPLVGTVAIAIAFLALAGCGGDDETTTSGDVAAVEVESTSMSKTEYAARAQKICTDEIAKIADSVRKAIKNESQLSSATVLPPIEGMLEKLIALGAPEGQVEQIEAFLTALQSDLKAAETSPSAAPSDLGADFEQSGTLAQQSGIPACGLGKRG